MAETLNKQLWLLGILRAIRMFMISIPVIAIYWNSFGLAIADIMILQVIFSVAWVLLELPSGYLADRFGNKPVIVAGCIMSTLGFGVYYFAPGYVGFVIAELLLALSASLVSGAKEAILHDSLSAHDSHKQYTKFHSRMNQAGFLSEAVASLLAGVVVSLMSLPAVLLVQCLVFMLSIPVSMMLVPHNDTKPPVEPLTDIIHYCFVGNKRLFWFNVFTGAVSASTLIMVWYSQLHWHSLSVPIEYFGILWAGFMLVATVGSQLAPYLERTLQTPRLFALVVAGPIVLYLVMSGLSTSVWSLAVMWMFWLVRGVAMPVISHYVQQDCSDSNRATVLSAQALMTRGIFSVFAPCLGWVADTYSFGTAFALSSLTFGLLASVGYWRWRKLYQATLKRA